MFWSVLADKRQHKEIEIFDHRRISYSQLSWESIREQRNNVIVKSAVDVT